MTPKPRLRPAAAGAIEALEEGFVQMAFGRRSRSRLVFGAAADAVSADRKSVV